MLVRCVVINNNHVVVKFDYHLIVLEMMMIGTYLDDDDHQRRT